MITLYGVADLARNRQPKARSIIVPPWERVQDEHPVGMGTTAPVDAIKVGTARNAPSPTSVPGH